MNDQHMYLLTDSMFRPIALFQRQDEADMASQLIYNSRVKEMRVRGSFLDYHNQTDSKLKSEYSFPFDAR